MGGFTVGGWVTHGPDHGQIFCVPGTLLGPGSFYIPFPAAFIYWRIVTSLAEGEKEGKFENGDEDPANAQSSPRRGESYAMLMSQK